MRVHKSVLIGFFLSALPVLWAALPLFRPGYIPTHDGEYHLLRIHEFTSMLSSGYLLPRWAPGFNSGYGVPLFIFHYPLPNYIGSLFHVIGFSLADSFKLTLASGYILAWGCAFLWLLKLKSLRSAVVGSLVFAFVPYWFVDLYVRGSMGEVLALALVMAILASIEYKRLLLTALFAGLLIPTHNIVALIFSPFLLVYAYVRGRLFILGLLAGVAIASFFWIPALFERQYVNGLNSVDFRDHFPQVYQLLIPSWGTGFSGGISSNQMSFQIGVIPLVLIFLFLIRLLKEKRIQPTDIIFIISGVVSILLSLKMSQWVWEAVPILQFVQYPWRLLSFIVVISAYVGARVTGKRSFAFMAAMAVLAIVVAASYARPVVYDIRDDAYYLSRRNFTDGTSSLGNAFSPVWSAWKSQRPERRFSSDAFIDVATITDKPGYVKGEISVPHDTHVKIHVAYYPGWTVHIDGRNVPTGPDTEGIITANIPQGTHMVEASFGETPLRMVGNGITILALFSLILWTIMRRTQRRRKSA